MFTRIYYLIGMFCIIMITPTNPLLYQSNETGQGFRQPENCEQFGLDFYGSVLENQLKSISLKITNWTWIYAVEERSPPIRFTECIKGRSTKEALPVLLNRTDVNPINLCLTKCSDNMKIYLTKRKCYCGKNSFNKNKIIDQSRENSIKCEQEHIGHLKCGRNDKFFCGYMVRTYHATNGNNVISKLWKNPSDLKTNTYRCLSVMTSSSGLVVDHAMDCKIALPYLCQGSQELTSSIPSTITSLGKLTIGALSSSNPIINRNNETILPETAVTTTTIYTDKSDNEETSNINPIPVTETDTIQTVNSNLKPATETNQNTATPTSNTTTTFCIMLAVFALSVLILSILLIYWRIRTIKEQNLQNHSMENIVMHVQGIDKSDTRGSQVECGSRNKENAYDNQTYNTSQDSKIISMMPENNINNVDCSYINEGVVRKQETKCVNNLSATQNGHFNHLESNKADNYNIIHNKDQYQGPSEWTVKKMNTNNVDEDNNDYD